MLPLIKGTKSKEIDFDMTQILYLADQDFKSTIIKIFRRQVLRAGALGRPRGMGCGGRQEGGSGWGTHVNPWLIHVNVWQKLLQYCKVISLQLIKINEKKSSETY